MTTDEIVETIDGIVRSPVIAEYQMGITKRSPKRRSEYLGVGFQYYVRIDTWLSFEEALEKEQQVFTRLTKECDQRSVLYAKYHHLSRNKNTPPSLGGREPSPEEKYDLYIAWSNR
jgi:hypothetical protein